LKKIVFIIPTLWAGLNQRHHHLASIFKKKGYDVQVVDFSSMISSFYIGTLQKKLHREELEIPHKRHTFKALLPSFLLQKSESNWKREREKFSAFLEKLSGNVFTKDTIIWLQGISIFYDPKVIKNLPKKLLISDIEDDYAGFVRKDLENEIVTIEKHIVKNADLVFTSAELLANRLSQENSKTYLIPNGVDEEFISEGNEISKPKDMPSGRIVGYHGVIADWFDFDLMYEVAKKLENEKVILLGRQFVSFNKEKFKKLTSLANVEYLGEKPYNDLLKYVAHFDVGIIPRVSSAFTKAINPKKFYEYLAFGKPIVATMMPELERYEAEGILVRASDVNSFVSSLKKMIDFSNNSEFKKKRLELAKENTWQKRYEEINKLIQEQFKKE
jgi:glycosyltransferase involved in cell wall biosynthesis